MPESSVDSPSDRDHHRVGKSLIRWIRRRFGSRWAKLAALLVLVVPIVWNSRELITTSIEGIENARYAWSRNHPSVPEVNPGRFVVGVLIEQSGHATESVLHDFQVRYWRDPLIEFVRVDVPSIPDTVFDRERLENQELAISRWIRKSGAAGVLWGNIEQERGSTFALLQWTGPDYNEFDNGSFERVIHKPTIVFPRLPIESMYNFTQIWIKQRADLHYEGSLGTTQRSPDYTDQDAVKAFQEVARSSCKPSTFTEDCKRLANMQIALFLADPWSAHLWDTEEARNEFYSCCFYYNATGRDPTDASPVVQSPDEFRNLFRQLDFLLVLADKSASPEDTDQYLCRAQLVIAVVQPDRIDVTVRKQYPNYRNILAISKALLDFSAADERLSNPVTPTEPSSFEMSVCKSDHPNRSQLRASLDAFQSALDSEVSTGIDSKYQLGVWYGQLGTMYAKAAMMNVFPEADRAELWKSAIQSSAAAITYLDRYKVRVPRYVIGLYLSYATILQMAGGAENAVKEQEVAASARTIAEDYDLSGLAHQAAIVHAIATGTQGVKSRNLDLLCESVHEWFEADRFTRSTAFIQLGPGQDEDDFLRNLKAFRSMDQVRYSSCLKLAGADESAVSEGIQELDSRSVKK